METTWKEAVMAYFKVGLLIPEFALKGCQKPRKNLNQDTRSAGRVFNPEASEYESGLLTT
jgi:hypothetical protein